MELWTPDVLFRVVDVTGVVGNGLLGGVVARSRGFDLIGFLILAVTSGLGGGMIRDVLLGQSPVLASSRGFPIALTDPWYLGGAIAAALVAYIMTLDGPISRSSLVVVDMLALGCWSATGAAKATAAGLGWIPAILLGVITGVGGGMLRDVMVNQTPRVFGGNPVYATFGIIAAAEMVAFHHWDHHEFGMLLAIVTTTALGVTAHWRNWQLPGPVEVSLRPLARRGRRDDEPGSLDSPV